MQKIGVEMRMMGRISISVNGDEVVWKTKRVGMLWNVLCLLAAREGEWVPSREMALLLWGEKDESKARNDVKSAVSHLRRELCAKTGMEGGDVIEFGNGGYRLGPAIDLTADFVELRQVYRRLEGRGLSTAKRLNHCRRLTALYQGHFYSEDAPPWTKAHAQALAADFAAHMEGCCAALWKDGRYEDILALYQKVGENHPPCDGAAVHYYRALHTLGRHDVILREFEAARADFESRGETEGKAFAQVKRMAHLAGEHRKKSLGVLDDVKKDLSPHGENRARVLAYPELKAYCGRHPGRYALTLFTMEPVAEGDGGAVQEAMAHLMAVAGECLRGHDIITPYSSNQLLVVMPNHSLDSSHQVRERLHSQLQQRLDPERVTVSTDVSAF